MHQLPSTGYFAYSDQKQPVILIENSHLFRCEVGRRFRSQNRHQFRYDYSNSGWQLLEVAN
jgi:hypothetical protein